MQFPSAVHCQLPLRLTSSYPETSLFSAPCSYVFLCCPWGSSIQNLTFVYLVQDHLNGKQYIGWKKIRDEHKVLVERFDKLKRDRELSRDRERDREERDRRDRRRDRSRDRSRHDRSRDRSRDRARESDYHHHRRRRSASPRFVGCMSGYHPAADSILLAMWSYFLRESLFGGPEEKAGWHGVSGRGCGRLEHRL